MGRAWKFGNNMNTDEIIPARFNITIIPSELAQNVFCEVRPEFKTEVQQGDIIIAGENFGCGSSREHAPIAMKASGIQCVIATSYARIFFRNAINIGLPILECDLHTDVTDGDQISVDLAAGTIHNETTGKTYTAKPLPSFVLKIAEAGGIVPFLKTHDQEELQ